jgi:hypothetical protein
MVCPPNAAFNRAAALASLNQTHNKRPSRAAGSCSHPTIAAPVLAIGTTDPVSGLAAIGRESGQAAVAKVAAIEVVLQQTR